MEWYVRASRAEGFHRKLTEMIRPALEAEDMVVDIGCGPGMMSLEIARYVSGVCAIDSNADAIAWLNEEIQREGPSNIRTALGDFIEDPEALLPDRFDVALFCYFGGPGEIFEAVYERAGRLVVMVTHGNRRRLGNDENRAGGTEEPSPASRPLPRTERDMHRVYGYEMEDYLKGRNISYEMSPVKIRFGQPFVSLAEAERYLVAYSGIDISASDVLRGYMEERMALVEKTGNREYPLYYPKTRESTIFFVKK